MHLELFTRTVETRNNARNVLIACRKIWSLPWLHEQWKWQLSCHLSRKRWRFQVLFPDFFQRHDFLLNDRVSINLFCQVDHILQQLSLKLCDIHLLLNSDFLNIQSCPLRFAVSYRLVVHLHSLHREVEHPLGRYPDNLSFARLRRRKAVLDYFEHQCDFLLFLYLPRYQNYQEIDKERWIDLNNSIGKKECADLLLQSRVVLHPRLKQHFPFEKFLQNVYHLDASDHRVVSMYKTVDDLYNSKKGLALHHVSALLVADISAHRCVRWSGALVAFWLDFSLAYRAIYRVIVFLLEG